MVRCVQDQRVAVYLLGVGIGPRPVQASRDTMVFWVLLLFTREETESTGGEGGCIQVCGYSYSFDGDVGDFNKVNAELHEP